MSTVVEASLCRCRDPLPTAILQTLVVKIQVNLVLTRLIAKLITRACRNPRGNTFNCSPARGDIANEQCLRRREVYLPKEAPLGFITKWLRGGSATRDLLLRVLSN